LEIGRDDDALPPMLEAVSIRRELAESISGEHRAGLAISLINVSRALSALAAQPKGTTAA
jgi:hypothetical protein